MKPRTLRWGRYCLELGTRTQVMGVLNITPDSFSDGGRFLAADRAVAQGLELVRQGADILDVGGESTRPFSEGVGEEEEIRRVVPAIETLAAQIAVPISIDTTKAAVARAAIKAGAALVNDIAALGLDADLAGVAAEHGLPVVLMHMRGTPRTMQQAPHYDDLLGEIRSFLEASMARAVSRGIARDRLIVDPGFGFGKTLAHNLELLRRLPELTELGAPVLIGTSRKAFIRRLVRDPHGPEASPDSPEVLIGTQATVAAAALGGADIVRVHDVAATRATLAIIDALKYPALAA